MKSQIVIHDHYISRVTGGTILSGNSGGLTWINDAVEKLENSANFGSDGTYTASVDVISNFLEEGSYMEVNNIPKNQIIFFWDDDTSLFENFTSEEIDSLYQWSVDGGKVIIAEEGPFMLSGGSIFQGNLVLEPKWGYSMVYKRPNNIIPTTAGNATSIFNGPFGEVSEVFQAEDSQGYFTSSNEIVVLGMDNEGNATLFLDCTTLDIVTEFGLFTTTEFNNSGYQMRDGKLSDGSQIVNEQDAFLANLIVFMDQLQQPPRIIEQPETLRLNDTYVEYAWYKDGELYSGDAVITNPETGTYYAEVVLNGGCTKQTEEVVVNCGSTPNIDFGPNRLLCEGEILTLKVETEDFDLLWSEGSTGNSITVSAPGRYWVRAFNTCEQVTDTIDITYSNSIDLGSDFITCEGNTINLSVDVPQATYEWQDGSTSNTFEVKSSGTYWVQATNPCGTQRDSLSVTYAPPIEVEFVPDTTLCPGDSIVLAVTTPFAEYQWNDGSRAPSRTFSQPGFYEVLISNPCGRRTENIQVDFYQSLDLGNDTSFCEGESLILDVSSGNYMSYQWSDLSTASKRQITAPGTYALEVEHVACGTLTDTIQIGARQLPSFSIGNDTTICAHEELILSAGINGDSYLWNDGTIQGEKYVYKSGEYGLEVTIDGCTSYDQIYVTVDECIGHLIMPNAFTPNNDGVNDLFVPKEIVDIDTALLMVYNRSGKVVFTSSDISWNGKSQSGVSLPDGVYFYTIRFTDRSGMKGKKQGVIHLLR